MSRRLSPLALLLPALLVTSACGEKSPATEDDASSGEASTSESSSTTTADTSSSSTESSSTTSATDTSSTSSTTDASTGGFVSSDTTMGCGTMCDIWNPTECPEGEKCTAVACEIGSNAWDTNVCRPIDGDKQEGDDCMGAGTDGFDDCAAGLMCWDANPDTGLGTCISFCDGSPGAPSCPTAGQLCAQANNGTLPICLDECDPLSPSCPDADDLCIPNPGEPGFVCVLDASGGMSPYGTPCNGPNEDDNSCNSGLVCIPSEVVPAPDCASSPGCCSPICDTTEPNTCPGQGQECLPFYMSPVPGYENVGICAIPT